MQKMKNKLIYVIMLALVAINFTACSDDDGPMIAPQDLNKDFGTTSGTALTITYSGEPLVGKKADFHTENSQTATITLNDIIPGEAQTIISGIQLAEAEGQYTFNGSTVTTRATGATVAYSGSVSSTELKLALNVTMPQSAWMKTYALAQLAQGDEPYWVYSRKGLRPPYTYTYKEMIRTNTVLTSAGYVAITHSLPAAGTTPQDTIDACNITTFTDKFRSALGCMLPQVLQTVSLEKDGNITAKYSSNPVTFNQAYLINPQEITPDTISALTAGRSWMQSPKNLAYWFEKDGKIYIKLNVASIVAQAMIDNGDTNGSNVYAAMIDNILKGDATSIKNMLTALDMDIAKALAGMSDATFATLLDWVKNGIPVKTATENGHAYLFLDREIFDPIMSEIPALLPVIENLIPEESRDMAMSTVKNILKGYQYTSKFEIGLDLTAQ